MRWLSLAAFQHKISANCNKLMTKKSLAGNIQQSVKLVSLDALTDGAEIPPCNIPLKLRAHLAHSELPHANDLNVNSMPTGLQLETSSRDAENEARILPIISSVK
jgi:hypothetical protein